MSQEPQGRLAKDVLERTVAGAFLNELLGPGEFELSSADPPEPDIIASMDGRKIGIELCALVFSSKVQAASMEARFLDALNGAIGELPWPNVHVRLVMQDDADTVVHEPALDFDSYKLLPRYLDGLFVHLGPCNEGQATVMLNQRSSNRPTSGLFPKPKDVPKFAEELARYVSTLGASDFRAVKNGWPRFHHAITANMVRRKVPSPARDLLEAVTKKLDGTKNYAGQSCDEFWLLVHNHPQYPAQWPETWHDYWHHRSEILKALQQQVTTQRNGPFTRVCFVDFSQVLDSCVVLEITWKPTAS